MGRKSHTALLNGRCDHCLRSPQKLKFSGSPEGSKLGWFITKMMWQKWHKWHKSGCWTIIYATYAIYASANFYSSGKIGRGFFISVQNYQKWFQKFCYLSQRTQRKQNCTYIKIHVRLWDFGTLKSHSLKVSVQIFTIFSVHGMGILQPHPRCERNGRLNGRVLKTVKIQISG